MGISITEEVRFWWRRSVEGFVFWEFVFVFYVCLMYSKAVCMPFWCFSKLLGLLE